MSAQTRVRKAADDGREMYDLLHALGAVRFVGDAAKSLSNSSREFSVSISNVPGPRTNVEVAGRRVEHLFSSSEPAAHHALRVSSISRAGTLAIGLCTDPTTLPHVARMAEAIAQSYADHRAAVDDSR